MSWALANLNSVIDMGFVLLVSAVCVRTLTGSGIDAEQVASRWRSELQELERVLRELITEAGSASSQLDRRLLRRKSELETLLKKLEDGNINLQANKASAPPKSAATPRVPVAAKPVVELEEEWELGLEDAEFPNDSWTDSSLSMEAERGEPEQSDTQEFEMSGLEELVASAEDTIELSSRIEKTILPREATAPRVRLQSNAEALATRIEKIANDEKEEAERIAAETFKRLSIMDPTAYRIARRLLADGSEIHIVARKLDLPISEIRLLDKLMREESPVTKQELEANPNYKPIEPIPARKIVRSEQRLRAAAARSGESKPTTRTIEEDIERELALL